MRVWTPAPHALVWTPNSSEAKRLSWPILPATNWSSEAPPDSSARPPLAVSIAIMPPS